MNTTDTLKQKHAALVAGLHLLNTLTNTPEKTFLEVCAQMSDAIAATPALEKKEPASEVAHVRQNASEPLTSLERAARLFIAAEKLGCDTPTENMIADAIQDAEFDTLHNPEIISERHGGKNRTPLEKDLAHYKSECAYLKLQRDALLEITWLDLPDEPSESIAKWKELFAAGWTRKVGAAPSASTSPECDSGSVNPESEFLKLALDALRAAQEELARCSATEQRQFKDSSLATKIREVLAHYEQSKTVRGPHGTEYSL